MDTRFLRSFLAVARRGSFTDAALELGVTQSTVTSHLQKLERQLGVLLLDRLPGGAVVTDAGARLIGLAEEVLLAEERLRTASSPQGGRPSGTVRLMAPETLCTYWLPAVVSTVSRAEPGVQIWVSPGGLADALDSVRRGAVDLAVTMEPFMPATDLDLTRIGRQSLVFIDQSEAPDGGSGTRQPATWDELARRDALLIEEGCGYSDHVADQLASACRPSGRRSRFGSVESIKRCVAVGLGWTVLPGIAVESELRARTLRRLEGPALPDCEIHVVSHPRRPRSPAAGVVLDELSRSCPAASGGYLSDLRDSRMWDLRRGGDSMKIAVAGATGVVGRHVVSAARQRGHDPVALGRSHGIDVATGEGLHGALAGVDVVIDVMNADSFEEGPATAFFTAAAGNLHDAARAQGAGHIVTLSIVGIDGASFGYYQAKLAQERATAAGPVPSTIQRATQFHEFPAQMIAAMRDGGRATIFDVRVQTVAARVVAETLLTVAEQPPTGRAPDLAGPQPANLVDLARAFAARYASGVEIIPDTGTMAGLGPDALLPGPGARIEGPGFEQWLNSEDAAALAL